MNKSFRNLFLLSLPFLALACARTAPASLYLLTPSEPTKSAEAPRAPKQRIGLLPVAVAGYLDKQQMVKRANANTLNLDNFHLWGEPLKENLRRVTLENLVRLRSADAVFFFPDSKQDACTLQIALRLTQCEGTPDGRAVLSASWEIYSNEKKQVIATRNVTLTALPLGSSHAELAAALSRLTGELSLAISKSVDESL